MTVFRAEAAGRAERLVDGDGETPPLASVVALCQRRDGHQRDSVRDPGAWRVRQGDGCDDGLVVTVAAGDREGRAESDDEQRKWKIHVRLPGWNIMYETAEGTSRVENIVV